MKHEMTYYGDLGQNCYEFSFIQDDVWKKDSLFCIFGERLVRIIAMDTGVPVDRIGFGKWGARLVPDENDSQEQIDIWIDDIEGHPSFKAFIKTCKVATDGTSNGEEINLKHYVERMRLTFDYWFSQDKVEKYFKPFSDEAKIIIKEAKEDLESNFEKFVKMVNRDAGWYEINKKGIIKEKDPFKGVLK